MNEEIYDAVAKIMRIFGKFDVTTRQKIMQALVSLYGDGSGA